MVIHKKSKAILLFSKSPERGKVKTRLEAVLGQQKALELYLKMLTYTLNLFRQDSDVLTIYLQGSEQEFVRYFGEQFVIKHQRGFDLGERLKNAFVESSQEANHLLVIGGDCVSVNQEYIAMAFASLSNTPVVIGPALDGGFVLLAINSDYFNMGIFDRISWGTSRVFSEMTSNLEMLGLDYCCLEPRWDIDEPDDLLFLKQDSQFSDWV